MGAPAAARARLLAACGVLALASAAIVALLASSTNWAGESELRGIAVLPTGVDARRQPAARPAAGRHHDRPRLQS